MKVLSMDLSLTSPAFAILQVQDDKAKVIHLSHLKTKTGTTQGFRLFQIYEHIKGILLEHQDVDEIVRERGFSRFPNVTQILFRVVGVSDISAYKHAGVEIIHEIAPTTVKKAVTGNGKASKEKVAEEVVHYLSDYVDFNNDDESDAVAVGVTYLKQKGLLKDAV